MHNDNTLRNHKLARLTNRERARIIACEFRGDEDLALAFGVYYRAQLADHASTKRNPVPECSSMAWEQLADGTIRWFACLADYEGLAAVYRLTVDGRLERLEAWPYWLIGLDLDPQWRATCRRVKANKARRQRRARERMARLMEKLQPRTVPTMPTGPFNDDIDLEDLERTLAELDGIAA
ncbi:hypothetical protein [Methylobacterium sp. CM6247]